MGKFPAPLWVCRLCALDRPPGGPGELFWAVLGYLVSYTLRSPTLFYKVTETLKRRLLIAVELSITSIR